MAKTDDPVIRTSISLRQSLWREVEAYAEHQGILSTADAVRRLLRDALDAAARKAAKR